MAQNQKHIDDGIPALVVKAYADEIFKQFKNNFEDFALGYQWPAPPNKSKGCLETLGILQGFTQSWQNNPSGRENVAVDVLRWGGIYKVKPSKPGQPNKPAWNLISLLIKATDGANCQKQYERVIHSEFGSDDPKGCRMPSWTKVLAVANPRQFFIYDSRVSYALNQLCADALLSGKRDSLFEYIFPPLSARGPKDKATGKYLPSQRDINHGKLLTKFHPALQRFPTVRAFYFDFYCELIKAVAERFYSELDLQKMRAVFTPNGTPEEEEAFRHETLPHLVEMALFMYGK